MRRPLLFILTTGLVFAACGNETDAEQSDATPAANAAPAQGGPGGGPGAGPGDTLEAGSFKIEDVPSDSPTVFEAFETTLAELDQEIGQRIQGMKKAQASRGWEQSAPALVVIRGDRTADKIKAEVTFQLRAEATDAAEAGLQAGTLPGGPTAIGVHMGLRTTLSESDAALDAWIKEQGKSPRGDARWYVFVNRTGDSNDPEAVPEAELKTLLYQPVE